MRYTVLDRFKAKTKAGECDILPGQVVTLSPDLAASLIEAGKIAPEDADATPSPGKPWTPPPSGQLGRRPARRGGQEIEARTLPPFKVIHSRVLGDTVLIVNTDKDAQTLKDAGILDAVYSLREAGELKGIPPASLIAHNLIKRVFPGSMIERGQI